ncbi:MAG: hypothetical protein AAB728_01970 [Patescibacteria group bacterium]
MRSNPPLNVESQALAMEFLKRCDMVLELNAAFAAGKAEYRGNVADIEAVEADGSGKLWAALKGYRARERAIFNRMDATLAEFEKRYGITPPQPAAAPSPAPSRSAVDASPFQPPATPEAVAVPASSDIAAVPRDATTEVQPVPVSAVPDAYGYRVGQTRTRFQKELRPGADDGFKYTQVYEGNGMWRLVPAGVPPNRLAELPQREKSPPRTGPGAPVDAKGSPDYSTPERTLRTIARLVAPSMPIGTFRALEGKQRWGGRDWEKLQSLDAQVRSAAREAGVPDTVLNAAPPRTPHELRRFLHLVVRAADYPAQVVKPEPEPQPEPETAEAPSKKTQFETPTHEGLQTEHPPRPAPEMTPSEAEKQEARGIAAPDQAQETAASKEGITRSVGTFLEKFGAWWKGLWGEKAPSAEPETEASGGVEEEEKVKSATERSSVALEKYMNSGLSPQREDAVRALHDEIRVIDGAVERRIGTPEQLARWQERRKKAEEIMKEHERMGGTVTG